MATLFLSGVETFYYLVSNSSIYDAFKPFILHIFMSYRKRTNKTKICHVSHLPFLISHDGNEYELCYFHQPLDSADLLKIRILFMSNNIFYYFEVVKNH